MNEDDDGAGLAYQQELEQQEQSEMSLQHRLAEIQQELNAPKGQTNTFGGYRYRSCEDILSAVKPLLKGLTIVISDEMVMLGDRFYVKATAVIADGRESIPATAYAREAATKKGMDESQITGSTSSYARKYALNGLLAIDDTKDADSQDNREHGAEKSPDKSTNKSAPTLNMPEIVRLITHAGSLDILKDVFAKAYPVATAAQKRVLKTNYDKRKSAFESQPEPEMEQA